MENPDTSKLPIINCHTHIFTGKHVPPYLAKTFVWWPFYYIFSVPLVLWVFRTVLEWKRITLFEQDSVIWKIYQFKRTTWHRVHTAVQRSVVLKVLLLIASFYVFIHAFYLVLDWITDWLQPNTLGLKNWAIHSRHWLETYFLLFPIKSLLVKWALVLSALFLFKSGRNLIFFLFKKIADFFGLLPGPMTSELIDRYLLLGRFATYKEQEDIFNKLENQYPPDTGFVVLPMDMEFMAAGKLSADSVYHKQMQDLAKLKSNNKNTVYPFVFIDPRRIQQDKDFFQYSFDQGVVKLEHCFVQEYIEKHAFSGFKIYPALGYYPFDEHLLPLWKYAADRELPIMTHAIRGTIFYRGTKKREWDQHPVFIQKTGNDEPRQLSLPGFKNLNFINHFTHPLNYLCLLEEPLLRKVVGNAKDQRVRDLFGYNGANQPLAHNLNHLKICFGHFGGDDEWKKFLEMDRYAFAAKMVTNPNSGIEFLKNNELSPARTEQLWNYVDWYSIICSMMLQRDHVYSDISYVLHSSEIFPLLKQTLANSKLKEKILFGTDFYVVRNHKSEKSILADTQALLTLEEFDQIARVNPRRFLNLK